MISFHIITHKTFPNKQVYEFITDLGIFKNSKWFHEHSSVIFINIIVLMLHSRSHHDLRGTDFANWGGKN
jgi:hypothetical protein